MKLRITEILSLIALGALSRLVPHLPNMTLLGGIALKARERFGLAGLLVPLSAMVLSDAIIGFYNLQLLVTVYLSLVTVGLLGSLLKGDSSLWRVAGVASVGSLLFFFTTNAAVWALSAWYPHTLSGLLLCYIAGLPFLGSMLAGDLLSATLLFKGAPVLARIFTARPATHLAIQ